MQISRFYPNFLRIFTLLLFPTFTFSQTYFERGDTCFTFAQMYVGADAQLLSPYGKTTFLSPLTGNPESVALPFRGISRLTLGGIHFGGHADFYVSVPLPPQGAEIPTASGTSTFSTGIETGARLYPWRLVNNTYQPFVGFAWSVFSYRQNFGEEGTRIIRHRIPIQAGASWLTNWGLIEFGTSWSPFAKVFYPLSRSVAAEITLPDASTWLGYKYIFDATVPPEETSMAQDAPAHGANRWSISAGISSAFPLTQSSYNADIRPFLDDKTPAMIFPECGIGYYFYDVDAVVQLAFRPIRQEQKGYGFEQKTERFVLSAEAIKIFGTAGYHGFTPFAGISLGANRLTLQESDGGKEVTTVETTAFSAGIIGGWDIRPTRKSNVLLRTALRYTPNLHLEHVGKIVMFDHLEWNLLQFVVLL